MPPSSTIGRKRDGHVLSANEIEAFVAGATDGSWSAEQLGAMLMAITLQGMDDEETAALTQAMLQSGTTLNWPEHLRGRIVDKHSTGGVGDKISIPLAPILAAHGLCVPMISGRGLGHTGGTLDKLEAIPGFSTQLTPEQILLQVEEVGCAIVAQTESVVPADRRLYAIRDVTGTVPSIPLITASIMSKKLAESLDALILDVKVGEAAFMSTIEDARVLATSMVAAGKAAGVKTTAMLTTMDHPLGHTIGNALEIEESIDVLEGKGPVDIVELVESQAAHLLQASGAAKSTDEGKIMARAAIETGEAAQRFLLMVQTQGSPVKNLKQLRADLPRAPFVHRLQARYSGILGDIDALALGRTAVDLGAGRRQPSDIVNPSVGFRLLVQIGETISVGQDIIEVHASSNDWPQKKISACFTIGDHDLQPSSSRIIETVN